MKKKHSYLSVYVEVGDSSVGKGFVVQAWGPGLDS